MPKRLAALVSWHMAMAVALRVPVCSGMRVLAMLVPIAVRMRAVVVLLGMRMAVSVSVVVHSIFRLCMHSTFTALELWRAS